MTVDPTPRRILVAGVSGVGKTTLCREIARRSGIPHTEIDALFHGPDWTPRPGFVADVQQLAARDAWMATTWPTRSDRPAGPGPRGLARGDEHPGREMPTNGTGGTVISCLRCRAGSTHGT